MTVSLPAWGDVFSADVRAALAREGAPLGRLDRSTVFGDSDGTGVTVLIVDSGVERDHPAVAGRLRRQLRVDVTADSALVVDDGEAGDLVGHGTACAGIIAAVAPGADIVSLRMLGADNRGKGRALAAAIEWAVAERIEVVNLSLSSRSEAMFAAFHDIADRSYFANTLLVCAANNVGGRPIRRSSPASYRSPPMTCPIPTPGSTTPLRPSSSGRMASTWTWPGGVGAGSARPATRSRRRISPATRHDSGRGTPARRRSRSRHCSPRRHHHRADQRRT